MYKAITLIIIASLLSTAGCAPKHNSVNQKAASPTSPSAPAPTDAPTEVKTETVQQQGQDPNSPPPSLDTSRPSNSTTAPAAKQAQPAPAPAPAPSTTMNTAPATQPQQPTSPSTPAVPVPSVPAAKPLPQAVAPQVPAPVAPQAPVQDPKASWRFSDLRVLRPDTLGGAVKGGVNVIYDNSLQTQERALFKIFDIGSGIFCSTVISGSLDKGDFLSFEKTDLQTWDQDKTVTIVGINFRSSNGSKKLRFECSSRGDITQAEFVKDMDTIVDFKDAQGNFPQAPEEQTTDQVRALEAKTKSFKIINVDTLSKTDVNAMGESKVMSISSGQLMTSNQAQQMIEVSKIQEACQLGLVKGKLLPNVVYNWEDTFDMGADHNRGYGMLRYVYKADEQNSIQMICIMRLTAKSDIIFDTFKGVLEFGAK